MPEQPKEETQKPESNERYLSSRKFLMAIFAHIINLYMMLGGQLQPNDGMKNVVWITLIYIVGEGLKDSGFLASKQFKEMVPSLLALAFGTPNVKNGKVGEGK